MAESISAPVGDKARKPDPKATPKQGPVANKKEDVELVQLMLKANGLLPKITGAVDGATIKAIQALEKSAGDKKPDGVIDPGDAAWKKGLPKLQKQIADDQKALAGKVIVDQGGKDVLVDKAQFEAEQEKTRKAMERRAAMFVSCAESWSEFARESNEALQGAQGFMGSMTEFFVQWKDKDAEPPVMVFADALSDAKILQAYAKSGKVDWKKLLDQDRKAVASHNAGVKAMQKWSDARIGSAGSIASGLTVVQDVSFGVVEVYVTAQLTLRGYSPAQANAMAAASVTALKTTANQIGESLAGNEKVTFGSAAAKVLWESLWSGVAGAAGGKLTGAFQAKLQKLLVSSLAAKFESAVVRQNIHKIVGRMLSNPKFQEMLVNLAKEGVGLFKTGIENGRFPTAKEFEDSLLKSVLAGVMKSKNVEALEEATRKAAGKVPDLLSKRVPGLLKDAEAALTKQYGRAFAWKFLERRRADLLKEINTAFAGKVLEVFTLGIVDQAGEATDRGALDKAGEDAVMKDGDLEKKILELIERQAKADAKKEGLKAG